LTQGLRSAGYNVVAAVEKDDLAARTYALNHPDVRVWKSDIKSVTGPALLRSCGVRKGRLDLLAACPPCQGFSSMRTRNGARSSFDVQNDLIFDVLRLTRSILPIAVMLENVPALADDARFHKFVAELHRLGYQTKSAILNTASYGVPQNRRRLILLASRVINPEFATPSKSVATVRNAIGHLIVTSTSTDPLHRDAGLHSTRVKTVIGLIPRNGGSRSDLGPECQLECHKRASGFFDVYGRMSWDKASPTITGGCINPSKGRFLHPTKNRAITLREAALLQSFPSRYKFLLERGRHAAALMIGNALPPKFIARHAKCLRRLHASALSPK
jgi:DNA (cytosine-5)-methyltransferase 1